MNNPQPFEKRLNLFLSPRKRIIVKSPPRSIQFRNSLNRMNLIRNEIFVLANSSCKKNSQSTSRPSTQTQNKRKQSSINDSSVFSSASQRRRKSLSVHRKFSAQSEEENEGLKTDCLNYIVDGK